MYKEQGLDQRQLVTCAYWEFLVHGQKLQGPIPGMTAGQQGSAALSGGARVASDIQGHHRPVIDQSPRTCLSENSNSAWRAGRGGLFIRLESHALSELTRQIAPPTKNGHAKPLTESRKSSQSVNPNGVCAR